MKVRAVSVCAGLDSAGVTVRHPGRPRPVSRCFNTTTLDIVKAAVRDEIPLTDSLTPALEPFRRGLFNLLVLPLFNRIRKTRCFVESRVGVFE